METYQVDIIQLVNAEGAFKKVGDGTLVIDDLRDEVRVTGYTVAGWVKAVLIILFIMFFPFPLFTFIFLIIGNNNEVSQQQSIASILVAITITLGLFLLVIYRKKVFPNREIAVRFSQAEIGTVGRGEKKWKGPVENIVQIFDNFGLKKWVEILPQSEADAQAIVDGACKLRDG